MKKREDGLGAMRMCDIWAGKGVAVRKRTLFSGSIKVTRRICMSLKMKSGAISEERRHGVFLH